MKKLMAILILVCCVNSLSAQEKKETKRQKMSAEQIATLKTKEMTLQLDLNERQQKQFHEMVMRSASERTKKMEERKKMKGKKKELSSDEMFEMKSKILDKRIEMKKELKTILTPEQFEKFEKINKNRGGKMKKKKMMMKKKGLKKKKMYKEEKEQKE